jgi:hypothetical protein
VSYDGILEYPLVLEDNTQAKYSSIYVVNVLLKIAKDPSME